jgi:hypothetical protein
MQSLERTLPLAQQAPFFMLSPVKRIWILKLLILSSWYIFIVLKCHFTCLWLMLFSNKQLTMYKDNVLKHIYNQWWTWKIVSYPRCDGRFMVCVFTIHIEIFMWINLSCSYGHFERHLLSTEKAWIDPNLDPNNSWCEYFGPTIYFFPRSQWCPMFNELWTIPWILIQCLDFGRKFLPMHCYVLDFLSSWKCKVGYGSNYGIFGKWDNFLNPNIHETKL